MMWAPEWLLNSKYRKFNEQKMFLEINKQTFAIPSKKVTEYKYNYFILIVLLLHHVIFCSNVIDYWLQLQFDKKSN